MHELCTYYPFCPLAMLDFPRIFCYLVIMLSSSAVAQALTVGAYWAFQVENEGAGPTDATFTQDVSVDTWPNGNPSFSYTGSSKWNFGSYGGNQAAFDGSSWISGRAFGWNANLGASTENTFQITLNTSGVEDLNVELRYRINGTQTNSGPVEGFSAFEYSVEGGAFSAVSGVSLSLVNNTNYNSFWQADLSAVSAIENAGLVTLRWTLPDLAQGANKQIRIDDLEVTATYDPVAYTSSSSELLELRTLVGLTRRTPLLPTQSVIVCQAPMRVTLKFQAVPLPSRAPPFMQTSLLTL